MEIISYNSENWIKRIEKRNAIKSPVTEKEISQVLEKKKYLTLHHKRKCLINGMEMLKIKKFYVLCAVEDVKQYFFQLLVQM